MSIAPLKYVAVVGRAADKTALLEGLQELGCIHLAPASHGAGGEMNAERRSQTGDAEIANAAKALQFLKAAPYRRRQVLTRQDFVFADIVERVLEVKTQLRAANDRRDYLEVRIADVTPWGDIKFPADGPPAGLHFWFYVLPRRASAALEAVAHPWAVVATDDRFAYVVVIADEEPPPDLLPVPRVHLGSQPLRALLEALRETEIEIDDLIAERIALTRYLELMTAELIDEENAVKLRNAEDTTFTDDKLCALEGWAPEDRLEDLERFVAACGLAVHSASPAPDDAPPTLLRQSERRQSGVDLSMFYQVPDYRSWDPTLLLLISFPLFFAMIMADAGYGLLLGIALAMFWRRLGGGPRGRSYRLLGAWIVSATCLYGALVGSYFGVAPPEGTLLAAVNVLSVNDFDVMMKLSIGIGVFHIVIANLCSAFVRRREPDMLSKIGWIAVCLGGYALYAASGAPYVKTIAILSISIGVAAIFLFSSVERGQTLGAHLKRGFDGAQALAGAMTAFGDVLSYMRLFALGLASASLAVTFNQLAANAQAAMPGLGFLAAGLILILGHGLNLALGIVSGVVHGLRLNYIEFFKWGFDEEGYAFTPFSKKRLEAA
ncbi:MAG: V-type ATP synthase subunit I [Pseudomonadota bacterium]